MTYDIDTSTLTVTTATNHGVVADDTVKLQSVDIVTSYQTEDWDENTVIETNVVDPEYNTINGSTFVVVSRPTSKIFTVHWVVDFNDLVTGWEWFRYDQGITFTTLEQIDNYPGCIDFEGI